MVGQREIQLTTKAKAYLAIVVWKRAISEKIALIVLNRITTSNRLEVITFVQGIAQGASLQQVFRGTVLVVESPEDRLSTA